MNKAVLAILATLLQKEPSELEELLSVEKEDDEKVNSFKSAVDSLKVLKPEEVEQMQENFQKEGYNNGKRAGVEMLTKDIIEARGLKDLEGFNNQTPMEKVIDTLLETQKKDFDKDPDKRVEELETDLSKLRSTVSQLTEEKEKLSGKLNEKDKYTKNYTNVLELVNGLPIGIKDENIRNNQRRMVMSQYMNEFEVDTEDGQRVVRNKATGEVVKDDMRNPIDPAKHVRSWAEGIVPLGEPDTPKGGRGEGSSNLPNGSGGELELKDVKTRKDFQLLLEQQQIDPVKDADKVSQLYREVSEKNPDFGKEQ